MGLKADWIGYAVLLIMIGGILASWGESRFMYEEVYDEYGEPILDEYGEPILEDTTDPTDAFWGYVLLVLGGLMVIGGIGLIVRAFLYRDEDKAQPPPPQTIIYVPQQYAPSPYAQAPAAQGQAQRRFCGACGREAAGNDAFCRGCGRPL